MNVERSLHKYHGLGAHHFTTTIGSFFGKMSLMYSSMAGYFSRTLALIPRWTDDFT